MAGTTTVSKAVFVAEEKGVAATVASLSKLAGQAGQTGAATSAFSKQASTALAQFAKAREDAMKGAASLAPAGDKAFVRVQQENAKAVRVVAKEIEGLTSRLDPAHKAMTMFAQDQSRINALAAAGAISFEQQNQLLTLSAAKYKQMGDGAKGANDNIKLTGNQVQNLGYQLNDVATMAAMGASPFQIIASQAGQVVQALSDGPGGVRGSLKAMGAGILAVATPTNLAIAGLTAAAGAALYFGTRADSSVKTAAESLERYKRLLDGLQVGYKSAADAAEAAFKRARPEGANVALADIYGSRDEMRASLAAEMDKLIPKTQGFVTSFKDLTPEVLAVQQRIRQLGGDLEAGKITTVQFRDEISRMRVSEALPPAMKKIVDDLRESSLNARDLENALKAVEAAAGRAAGKMGRFDIPTTKDMADRFGGSGNLLGRMDPAGHAALVAGLNAQRDELLDPKKSPHDEYLKAQRERMTGYSDELAALKRQNAAITTTTGELAELEFVTDSLAEARRAAAEAGEKLLPEDEAQIRSIGKSIGELTDQMERLRLEREASKRLTELAKDIGFERSQLGRSDSEQSIASTLRQNRLTEADPTGAYLASQMRINDSLSEFRELHRKVWQGVTEDILAGAKAGDIFENALKGIGSKLLTKSMEGLEQTAFNGLSSLLGIDLSGSGVGGKLGTAANPMHVTFGGVGGAAASLLGGADGKGGAMDAINTLLDGGKGGGLPGGSVKAQIANYFADKGLKPHQVAGILGNVSAESAFNPKAIGDAGEAFGLFQHNDRKAGLFNAIGGRGNLGDVKGQLDFVWKELQTTESASLKRLLASTDVRGATAAFAGFERPRGYSVANPEGAHNFSGRLSAAEDSFAEINASAGRMAQLTSSATSMFAENATTLTSGLGSTFKSLDDEMLRIANDFTPKMSSALQSILDASAASMGNTGGFLGKWLPALAGKITGGMTGAPGGGDAWAGLRMKTFAKGGVANIPSIFAEAGPEAAVPLPDGRSIPVTLRMPSVQAPAMPAVVAPTGMASSGPVSVQIVNQTGVAAKADVQRQPDGSLKIMLSRMVADEVGTPGKPANRALQAGGLRQPLKSR